MEDVILEILPYGVDWLSDFALALGQFFAGGALISFLAWVLSFTVASVFYWILARDKE